MRLRLALLGFGLLASQGGGAQAQRAQDCRIEPLSDYMQMTQSDPQDEGQGRVSMASAMKAPDGGGSVTDVIVLDCASGDAAELAAEDQGRSKQAGRRLTAFLKVERKAGRLTDIAGLLARGGASGFETKRLQGAKDSPMSICSCQAFYPAIARKWASRSAPYGVSAAY